MSKCVLIVQLEIPQILHNLFSPSDRIGQSFWIFLKKSSHHMSIIHDENCSVNQLIKKAFFLF
jgi:hypothetical protein